MLHNGSTLKMTHTLGSISLIKPGILLGTNDPAFLQVIDEVNEIAKKQWPDFDLVDELDLFDPEAHLADYLMIMRDENNNVAGFRSARWEPSAWAWLFENGVVRDIGNALGSNMLHLCVRFFLTSREIPEDRRTVVANIELTNRANWRQYQNFMCREPGYEGRRFVHGSPTKKAMIKGGGLGRFSVRCGGQR